MKFNIAIAGGPCTGKSTLTAALFARLKEEGLDVSLVAEQYREIKKRIGPCRSAYERYCIWDIQEEEEIRSSGVFGFITDMPLFQIYTTARAYFEEGKDPRDELGIEGLYRKWHRMKERYSLIVIARDPKEIPYRKDGVRKTSRTRALRRHQIVETFVQHYYHGKCVYVHGTVEQRVEQVISELKRRKVLVGRSKIKRAKV